jgi:hypothetical protein
MLGELRFHDERDFGGGLAQALRDLLFEARIERDGPQPAVVGLVLLDDLKAERPAGVLGEVVRVLRDGGVVADFFEDAGKIADRQALGQQVLTVAWVFLRLSSNTCTSWRLSSAYALRFSVSDRCVTSTEEASTTV